jgi:hypothetical protein
LNHDKGGDLTVLNELPVNITFEKIDLWFDYADKRISDLEGRVPLINQEAGIKEI